MPGGDQAGDGVEDTGGFAGGLSTGRRLGIEATQARADCGQNREGEAVAADGSAIDPGDSAFDREIVDEVAGFKVVGGIEDEVDALEEVFDVGCVEIDGEGFDGDFAIEEGDFGGGGGGFGALFAGMLFVKKPLPLEVGPLDDITVEDLEVSNTGPGESAGLEGAESTAPNNRNLRCGQARLAFSTKWREADLPRVAVWLQHLAHVNNPHVCGC